MHSKSSEKSELEDQSRLSADEWYKHCVSFVGVGPRLLILYLLKSRFDSSLIR